LVDATNVEVTNVKANDGTASLSIADSTGVVTVAAAPVLTALTASQAVFTDASKGLVSNAITGTGDVVMSASPTLTGTVTAATLNATTLGGTLSTAAQTNITSVGTLSALTVSGTSALNNTVTVTGPNVGNSSLIVRNANSANSGELLLGGTTFGAKITRDSLGADQDLLITNSHGAAQGFKFRTGSTTAGTTDLLTITGSGNVGIGVTPTSRNNTSLQIVNGIGFPATQVASSDANTLDDYEEGVFTSTVTPATSGSITLVTGVNTLAYTKVGRVIQVQGLLEVTSVASPVGGSIQLSGLPYTSSDDQYSGVSGGAIYVASLSTGNAVRGLSIPRNNTVVDVIGDAANYQAGSQLYVQFTYRV
jgi:hypothetical protein